jgi:protein-tyrosine phosphatase
VTSAFEDEFYAGEYCYLDEQGNYLLVEFSSTFVPETAEQLIYNLYCDDVIPIIAHPERNAIFHGNPDLLCTLVEAGALTQITAGSLIGKFGKNVQKFSYQLIKNNLAHVIASDAHNTSRRGFFMREAYEKIGKTFGEHTKRSFEENAQLVFSGSSIKKRQPMPITWRIFPRMF